MKTHFHLVAFVLLPLLFETCPAFAQQPVYTLVPTPAGSGFGSIGGMQDQQGYMWVVTPRSLDRYDGYNYVSYIHDPLNSNSLAIRPETVYADRHGFIWIGTLGSGLDRLDPVTGNFKHYRYNPEDSSSLSSDTVRAILEDQEGLLWIGTQRGLNRYDPKTGKFKHFYHEPQNLYSLSCNQVEKLYEDRQGTIWIGTGNIWHGEGGETDEGGLNRFDKKTGRFIRYLHDPANPQSLISNKVRAIFEDSRGTFWIGTAGDGLHTMDRASNTFIRHRHDPAHPEKLSRPPEKKARLGAHDHITFIIEDITGAIWIGTLENGLARYDPKTNKVTHIPKLKDKVSGVETDVPWWACTSRDGLLWIGFWEGLFRIDPMRKNISYFATGRPVIAIYEDTSGVLWYGAEAGLVREDQTRGTVQRFVHDPRYPHSISNNRINTIYEDRKGVLWIGTGGGLNRFDRKTGTFVRYNLPVDNNSLNNQDIAAIYEGRQGYFWVGTHGGLIRIDRQANTYTHYLFSDKDTNSLSNREVSRIYEDNRGNLWIAVRESGLNLFIPRAGNFKRFLYGKHIHSLCQDSDGIIWIGTSTGLYRSNALLNSFSRFTGANGEFLENMIVNGVLEDNKKAIWINTSIGICRLNSLRNEVVMLSRYQDPVYFDGTGYYKGKTGKLFFGGGSGYFTFFPEELTRNTKPPQIVINQFRLAEQPVVPGKESPLKQPLSETKKIFLSHNQNIFSFDFAGIHYSDPQKNRHLFMLEGLDIAWRKAGEEKTAYYYNVPPGRYIFHIKASNSDGVWAEKAITVIVAPPWWQTWWFRITAIFCVFALFYAIVRWRLHQKFRFQLERSEKEKQLAEFQQQKAELEMQALRAQMNPHFIFNCLSSINRFILKNESESASDYLTKFSRLIRMVLTHSKKELITLDDELEMLRLYLEMERLRFKYSFDYSINFKNEIDPENIFIPPLLLQPFAENAIWNGLMNKEGQGHLTILLSKENDILYCIIEDNGVGRAKAAELKSKSVEKKKSLGIQITKERLALLNGNTNETTFFEVEDLYDTQRNAIGTRVILKIRLPERFEERSLIS